MAMMIGNVRLDNKLLMAPMAGITDMSFRQICREMGAALCYTEMISCKSIQYKNVKQLLDCSDKEQPRAVQIFGREPEIMAEAVRQLGDTHAFDIIDINMGCPAPKIVKNGEGCALMKEPALVGRIVEAVCKATKSPVTIKIRKGFTSESTNAIEVAKTAQEAGAAAVTVHGRTREQFYSGQADWDAIAKVKSALHIPVIANGDVTSPQSAAAILSHTNCDALMIARGALGNPWLFSQILNPQPEPTWHQKKQMALRHCQMTINHKGHHIAILEMRKHLSWYIKGLAHATKIRQQINQATTYNEIENILNSEII